MTMFDSDQDKVADPGWVCDEPECNGRSFPTKQGLRMHQRGKHPAVFAAVTTPDPRTNRRSSPRIPRGQKLEGSLSVLVLGLGLLSPPIGGIWTPYVPNIANALDACAAEYKWARTLVDAIENAGPISLLFAALAPPLLQTFVHLRLLPPSAAQLVGGAGVGPPPPSAPPASPFNDDGSVDLFGQHFSAEQVAQANEMMMRNMAGGAGAVVTEVPVSDGGQAA